MKNRIRIVTNFLILINSMAVKGENSWFFGNEKIDYPNYIHENIITQEELIEKQIEKQNERL